MSENEQVLAVGLSKAELKTFLAPDATCPARDTTLPWMTAWLMRGPGSMRLIGMGLRPWFGVAGMARA